MGEPEAKKAKIEEPTSFPTIPMEGKKVPSVVLKARKDGDWLDVNTEELFAGKTVVVFSLPGAFTPTCSSTHLPRYEALAPVFKKNGVDEIICLSVNDGFVMDSWAQDQKTKHVTLLPDGNCEFTEKMGMATDKSAIGFGRRSWRYSMIVKDGTIEKIFPEPVKEGDPFEVSDAITMLKYIKPDIELPPSVVIFTKMGCAFCHKAKALLESKELAYDEVVCGLGGQVSLMALEAVSDTYTTPRVFIGGKLIGGFEELEKHLA